MLGISFLCRAKANLHRGEMPGYLGGRLRAHKGHELVAQNILHFGKNPNIASFDDHAYVISWSYEKSNCTCGFLLKFWYEKTSYVCPKTRNNKRAMVISVMLVLIYHRHCTHGSMKTPDSGHFVNQRRTLRKSISATLSKPGRPHIVGKP